MTQISRPLPQNLEAERSVLGAICIENKYLFVAAQHLNPSDFFLPRNRVIFREMLDMANAQEPIDELTLSDRLRSKTLLEQAGGAEYVSSLTDGIPRITNVSRYAQIVAEKSRRRQLAHFAQSFQNSALEDERPVAELLDELERIAREIRPTTNCNGHDVAQSDLRMPNWAVQNFQEITERRLKWLWPHRFPRGKFSLILGDPGVSKSVLLLHIAALISRGLPFPDGAHAPRGTTVVLSAEDSPEDTVKPRLRASGADCSRIIWFPPTVTEDVPGQRRSRTFSLERDLERLETTIVEHSAVAVIFDPISSFMGRVDGDSETQVRGALTPLIATAARTGVAVLAIRHWRKAEGPAIYRALGSLGFVAAARVAYGVAPDPQNSSRLIFGQFKSNLGPSLPPLAYELEGFEDTVRIKWANCDLKSVPPDLFTGFDPGEHRTAREEAIRWLQAQMQGKAISASALKKRADRDGISWRTLNRVKDEQGIRSQQEGRPKRWKWAPADRPDSTE